MGDQRQLAEGVRAACVAAALEAYEDAGLRGLCGEGRWEVALRAIQELDLNAVPEVADLVAGSSTADDDGTRRPD